MPEYLAPGVYVEEIDTGSKPIEGVSTSTSGMIGVTERGPVNIPIIITSSGEFQRWFGGFMRPEDYSNGADRHCFLPHAVQGFFTNGGKRVFITRVLDIVGAQPATFDLHNRGSNTSAVTWLLRAAPEASGGAGDEIYVLNINAGVPNSSTLANGDRLRIGAGSESEYRNVAVAPAAALHVALNYPLNRGHAAGDSVDDIHRVLGGAPNAFTLADDAPSGSTSILVAGIAGGINAGDLLEIGGQWSGELRFAGTVVVAGPNLQVTLDSALNLDYLAGAAVAKLDPNPGGLDQVDANTLDLEARIGDRVVYLTSPRNNFTARADVIIFNRGNAAEQQARRIGSLGMLNLTRGAYGIYPAGSLVEGVALAEDGGVAVKSLTAAAVAGSTVITLDNRTGLAEGDVLRIGAASTEEYGTIVSLPNPSPGGAAPNAGNLVLSLPLNASYLNGTEVALQNAPTVRTDRPRSVLALDLPNGATFLAATDGGQAGGPADLYQSGDFIRVITFDGTTAYHVMAQDAIPLDARPVQLGVPLERSHSAGSPVAERAGLFTVQAIDAGIWGNRLRVSVEDETAGLVVSTTLRTVIAPNSIRLASISGVEPGTILELIHPNTGETVGDPVKVGAVNRATGEITLDAALTAAQLNTIAGLGAGVFLTVRSREFRLTMRLLRQPDPAAPSRNESVLDLEVFRYLSMDDRHSRYIHRVIGTTWDMTLASPVVDDDGNPLRLMDRRSEGESWYIRVRDVATTANELHSIRLGPETLVDRLSDGRTQAARHPLDGGNDSINTLTDTIYIGTDDSEPLNRTGLATLRNEEEISIVAAPGRTSSTMQAALIAHCELMRYRFGVLDGPQPPADSLNDVQNLRQQYDSKYAALYHPWLLIQHPYPTNLAKVPDYAIPPAGHMLGIYARTDIERGVHKAPANEVVRGIIGLQRVLRKEQQDILNPYPVNINVIRDFRAENRGLRVYGARVITSDPDWKYVNVRRLLIFIEASLDRGLQWVVFEPNAEPLWARVRRSVSNFLTTVWRNGALEGTKVEEAYFVKCDRTTMTQTDIDNGKLIVVIGVAPVKPAEFVIIRIGLWTAHAED